jgi:MFS transporter, DHA3 family, macrolide efflux protein
MQGRVMSLLNSGATAIAPLGLLIAGPFSDLVGIRVWFWAGGMLCVLIAVAGFFIPAVMDLEENRDPTQQPLIEPL